MSVCIDEVFSWMMSNRLQLNPSKTEVLWCSPARRQHQIPTGPVRVGDTSVQPVWTVRDLGVYIDADVTMSAHVTAVVKACFAALCQIRSVHVLEKRPLNGCSSSTWSSIVSQLCDWIISGGGDARYRTLAESYANLSRDYENLKSQYNDILLAHEDVCAEMKLLKKELLVLQSLVTILIVHVTFFDCSCYFISFCVWMCVFLKWHLFALVPWQVNMVCHQQ